MEEKINAISLMQVNLQNDAVSELLKDRLMISSVLEFCRILDPVSFQNACEDESSEISAHFLTNEWILSADQDLKIDLLTDGFKGMLFDKNNREGAMDF